MKQWTDLIKHVIDNGEWRNDRTGVGTLSVFGGHMQFDLRDRFPLVQAKETRWKTAFLEMLFFLSGQTNAKWMEERGSKLWTPWGDANGNLGPVYGFGWRRWGAKPDNIPQPKPKLRDGLTPTFCGVASGIDGPGHRLFGTWTGMIQRCYDQSSVGYKNYGAKGVHVCDEWLEFTEFSKDAETLPGYANKAADHLGYEIDKDIIGTGFRYARDCCTWVTKAENIEANIEWETTLEKDGRLYTFRNASQFCREQGVDLGNLDDLWLKGGDIVRYGFRLVSRERIRPEIDQVKAVIEGIRTNPHGRRHIVTAWNVAELDYMALPPCHHTHQLYAAEGNHLDMQVHQRSWDLALGAPFNISAYALLLHLYARATGRKARHLHFSYGDAHVYTNHVGALEEMMHRRYATDLATLVVKTDNTDIDSYQPDDFDIVGYEPQRFIKLEVAV